METIPGSKRKKSLKSFICLFLALGSRSNAMGFGLGLASASPPLPLHTECTFHTTLACGPNPLTENQAGEITHDVFAGHPVRSGRVLSIQNPYFAAISRRAARAGFANGTGTKSSAAFGIGR